MIGAAAVIIVFIVLATTVIVLLTRQEEPIVAITATTVDTDETTRGPGTTDRSERSTTTRRRTTTTAGPSVLWTPWSPPDESFTIDFTGTPFVQRIPTDGDVFDEGYVAESQSPSSIYVVGWYDLTSPIYANDSVLLLNTIADAYASSTGLRFATRTLGHFAGNPSLDFTGTMFDNGSLVDVRALVIVSGIRVYLFLAGANSEGQADFEHFRDSFHIT